MHVLLDIHALAGSQNGFDNSGHVGGSSHGVFPFVSAKSLRRLDRLAEFF